MVLGRLPVGGSDDDAPTPMGVEVLRDVPHLPQNCASDVLSLPHAWHFISNQCLFHNPASRFAILLAI